MEGAEPEPAASATGSSMHRWAGGSLTGTQAPPCSLSSGSGEYAEKSLFCLFPDCAELSDITVMVPVIARVIQQPVLKPRPSTGSCTARPRGSPTATPGASGTTDPSRAGGRVTASAPGAGAHVGNPSPCASCAALVHVSIHPTGNQELELTLLGLPTALGDRAGDGSHPFIAYQRE